MPLNEITAATLHTHRPSSDSLHIAAVFFYSLVKRAAFPRCAHPCRHNQHNASPSAQKQTSAKPRFFPSSSPHLYGSKVPMNWPVFQGQVVSSPYSRRAPAGLFSENMYILPHHTPGGISEIQIGNEPLSSFPASRFCHADGERIKPAACQTTSLV